MRRHLTSCGIAFGLAAASASAQSIAFTQVGSIAGPADMLRVQGTHAYISAGRTLTIYDLASPAAPKRLGAYTFPEEIWSFRVNGSYAYVGANFFGLGILDLSNRSAPVLAGSFKPPGQAKTAAVFEGKALIIDHMEGVVLANISNMAKPVGAGSFFVDGYARDIVTAGSHAYAVDSPTGFYVFDLSGSNPLEPIATLQSGTGLRTVEISDAAKLAVLVGGGTLQPYDVSNPAKPVKLAPFRTPGGAQRVALDGRTAYVADAREGLQLVDFSNSSAPAIVGGFKTAAPARDVAVSGPHVLVLVGAPQEKQEVLILQRTR
jgi:hypothetical protein